jgi:hypothetical protein
MSDLDPFGAWRIFIDVQVMPASESRTRLLRYLLCVLDTHRFDRAKALRRALLTAPGYMSPAEIEAYLLGCLNAHFADWMLFRMTS